jgi:hypothetical protein
VPEDQFDLSTWQCGTAACAVGHAARDPQFQIEGLRLSSPLAGYPTIVIDGEELKHWDAVQVFFELREDQAYALFNEDAYRYNGIPNPRAMHVVARINDMIARHQQEAA